jgi:REP element-mobilizing transposase RayT
VRCEETAWHVFGRGTRRLALFYEDQDYRQFLWILADAVKRTGCRLWGYELMSNHYHLEPYGTSQDLSRCMWRVGREYSLYHNDTHGLRGHTFEGPYQAFRQRTGFFALRTLAYVFNNAVAAGIVERAEDYPWSCYRSYLGLPGSPLPVDPAPALRIMNSDLGVARKEFRAFVEHERWRVRKRRDGAPTASAVQQEQFRWLLEHAREREGDVDGLTPTQVALRWGQECGIPPRAMAAVLGKPPEGAIRQAILRVRQHLEQNPDLAQRLPLP